MGDGIGALLLIPLAPTAPAAVPAAGAEATAALAFLGLGASALGFFTWGHALSRLEVHRAASCLYAVPVVAIAVAWLWLGEVPSALSMLGGAVALAGVAGHRTECGLSRAAPLDGVGEGAAPRAGGELAADVRDRRDPTAVGRQEQPLIGLGPRDQQAPAGG